MPKITSWHWEVDGKDVEFKIVYSLADARTRTIPPFHADLPLWMAGVLDQKAVYGETHTDVEQGLREAVTEYGKRKSTEQKVIFYVFKSMVRELNFEGPNESRGLDEMCSEGVALDLWFRVGYIVRDPTKDRNVYLTENHEHPEHSLFGTLINQWTHYMPYTKEREQFFLAFREYLVKGIVKMQDFFKEVQLPELIDETIRKQKRCLSNNNFFFRVNIH
jgi:hypothetical protein